MFVLFSLPLHTLPFVASRQRLLGLYLVRGRLRSRPALSFTQRSTRHVVCRPPHPSLRHSSRHRLVGRLRPRSLAGKVSFSRHQPRHHVRVLCRHSGRRPRAETRSANALLCRELRTHSLRVCPRFACRSRFCHHVPSRWHHPQSAEHRCGADRHGAGRGDRPGGVDALHRFDGCALRCHNQYPRTGCGTADAQATRPTVGRCRPELCGDLPHRHDRRHHCASHHARLVAASRPRQRGRQRRRSLHHLLLRAQSRPVWAHHPRHRVACRTHPFCGVAAVARRQGAHAQRFDRSARRRPLAHHHAQGAGTRADQSFR